MRNARWQVFDPNCYTVGKISNILNDMKLSTSHNNSCLDLYSIYIEKYAWICQKEHQFSSKVNIVWKMIFFALSFAMLISIDRTVEVKYLLIEIDESQGK